MSKKLLFHGNGIDAENHIRDCKVRGCETCKTLQEFLNRIKEDEGGA